MKEHGVVNIPLCLLVKWLETLSHCHAVYFVYGWEKSPECRLVHEVAKAYGLKIMYQELKEKSEN